MPGPPDTTPPTSRWWDYVAQHRGTDSNRAIARRLGLTTSTVTRWQTAQPTVDSVRAFATTYGRPMLEAFIHAGFLSVEEAQSAVVEIKQELTDRQLTELMLARLAALRKIERAATQPPPPTTTTKRR